MLCGAEATLSHVDPQATASISRLILNNAQPVDLTKFPALRWIDIQDWGIKVGSSLSEQVSVKGVIVISTHTRSLIYTKRLTHLSKA